MAASLARHPVASLGTARLLFVAFAMVAVSSCSDREAGGSKPGNPVTSPSFTDGTGALRAVQNEVDTAAGYTVTVSASNYVLRQWGGSDGGTVRVNRWPVVARAVLGRTGERGTYQIVLVGNETFFKRETCGQWARIPGGGANVLQPFLFAGTDRFANASDAKLTRNGPLATVEAHLDGLGAVSIEFDGRTARPTRLTAPNATTNGVTLTWEFSRWGERAEIQKPKASYDRGPGGDPC